MFTELCHGITGRGCLPMEQNVTDVTHNAELLIESATSITCTRILISPGCRDKRCG